MIVVCLEKDWALLMVIMQRGAVHEFHLCEGLYTYALVLGVCSTYVKVCVVVDERQRPVFKSRSV